MHPVRVQPAVALPTFARLYGVTEADLASLAGELCAAWTIHAADGGPLGALGLRPTPAHGAEVVGGALPGPLQPIAAVALLQAARAEHSRLYAYAEAHLWPEAVLAEAGLRPVGAYTRHSGPLPLEQPTFPPGLTVQSVVQTAAQERLKAQRFYSDRIGHTTVPDAAADPDFGGSDDTLGVVALDPSGEVAGMCRVWLEGTEATLTTPAVRPDWRGTSLRRALLLAACQAARAAGATGLTLEAWGDTDAEQAEDARLDLTVTAHTPIYAFPTA